MVEIVDFEDIGVKDIVKRMKDGELIIFPTDTVYALGCNAMKQGSVAELRRVIKSQERPLSVVAPSKRWIYNNFHINKRSYIQTLPGPFTFLLEMKNRCVARNLNPGMNTLGVRIPYHAFTRLVQKANVPFVITSLDRKPVREISKIPRSILRGTDLVIDDGFLANHASTIIDLSGDMARIVK